MSVQGPDTPAVDVDELKEIMGEDAALIRECFDEFLKIWPEQYVDIKKAVIDKDASGLDHSAHALKGSLKCLAAGPAAEAALSLERAGKENNFADIHTKLAQLETECRRLVAFIKKF